jgi:hypothetical protein
MRTIVGLLLGLLALSPAWGQIRGLEDTVSPYKPIVIDCEAKTPEGAEIKVQWSADEGAAIIPVGNSAHVWAEPGPHKISCTVVWMQFEVVELPDGKTIKSLQAWDVVSHEKAFTVSGAVVDPDDPVDPPPGAEPFSSPGFAVVILREAQDNPTLPAAQVQIFTSAPVHQYCGAKAVKLSDGKPFYRIWDDDYTRDQLANVPAELRDAYLAVQPKATSLPWIAVTRGNGKGGFSGPLPGTVAATLDLLKRFGG